MESISKALSMPVAAKLSTGSSPARPEEDGASISAVDVDPIPPAAIAPGPAGFGFGAAFFAPAFGAAFFAGSDASSSA